MEKHLHIISLDIPYPPNYGGVIDLFWKLPALQNEGIKIHLHCFCNEIIEQKELKKYCVEVNYYKRSKNILQFLTNQPFIVSSRNNEELKLRLLRDNYPILIEGVHCSSVLFDERFKNRKLILRLHNVEHEYYKHLEKSSKNIFKKLYFKRESIFLKKIEEKICDKNIPIFTVTQNDSKLFTKLFNAKSTYHLPIFLPTNWQVNILQGKGNYCLYNGDLSVAVNIKSVLWLINNVAKYLPKIKFIIAGKNPTRKMLLAIQTLENVELIANPNDEKMQELIANAQINIIPSKSSAGIKLKLLNALFNGKFCIANNETISGSDLECLCIKANTAIEFIDAIEKYFLIEISKSEIDFRKNALAISFNNKASAEKIIASFDK